MQHVFLSLIFSVFTVITFAQKPVIQAVLDGDVERLETLIKQGADLNETNDNGLFPLAMVLSPDHDKALQVQMGELLLENGANPNRDFEGKSLVKRAVQNNHAILGRLLLKHLPNSKEDYYNELYYLWEYGSCMNYTKLENVLKEEAYLPNSIKQLIEEEHVPNIIRCGNVELLKLLKENDVCLSCFKYNNSTNNELIKYIYKLNDDEVINAISLHYNHEALSYWKSVAIDNSVNWNKFKTIITESNKSKWTDNHHYDLGNFLVTYEASKEIFEFCLQQGIQLNKKGTKGATTIMLAAQMEDKEIFKLLANTYPKAIFDTDDLGWTVYDYALWLPYLENTIHTINRNSFSIKVTKRPQKDNVDKFVKDTAFMDYLKSLNLKRGKNYVYFDKVKGDDNVTSSVKNDDRFDYFSKPIQKSSDYTTW